MINIILFSQNVFIDSLCKLPQQINITGETVFLSPHLIYENERERIKNAYSVLKFYTFADFLSDQENESCDVEAYNIEKKDLFRYYGKIKELKNIRIAEKINALYPEHRGILCSDDLGIDAKIWKKKKYEKVTCEYYYIKPIQSKVAEIRTYLSLHNRFYQMIKYIVKGRNINQLTEDVYVAHKNGKKYVFLGKQERISYRMDLDWKRSSDERNKLVAGNFETSDKCQYLSTLHESSKCKVPDKREYDVRYIQDGYLPPNYSSAYLKFKPKNVSYYAWDIVGEKNFKHFDLPVQIMPFRKKLYMPKIDFRDRVKTVLIATSGPGDWTAQKNRSDEDLMLQAFVQVARRLPDVEFIYRCHPTWIHPEHNGVNSINRVAEYIEYCGCKNLHLSSNIPVEDMNLFILSFPRSSLKDDLNNSDMVFGEHSVSMIDAALLGLPFSSVNLSGRRDLFSGMTDLGFPNCNCVDSIVQVILNYQNEDFQRKFNEAVDKYNSMTDCED